MSRKIRLILLISFSLLFLIICPLSIFYSQGYRFDFERKKLVQTGGLFLKISPKQANIFLNGKIEKKTNFFFGSALIENLLPQKYKVRVEKDGYHPWEKVLEIKPKEVTEAKNIILFPKNPNLNLLASEVEKFWVSPDQKKIILKEREEKGWVLKLYNLEKNVKSILTKEVDISTEGADLLDLSFSDNSKEIYLKIGQKEKERNFLLNLEAVPPILIEKEPEKNPENILAIKQFENNRYWLDHQGNLFKNELKISQKPFSTKEETPYTLEIFPGLIFLKENEILYQFDFDSGLFEKFLEPVKDLKISPDLKKIAIFSDYEIWIFFAKEETGQPKRGEKEKLFLARFSEKIQNLFWLTNYYLIFNSGEKIKISEIDDRDRINILDLGEFKEPEIFWIAWAKKLYLLSEGRLYFIEIPFL